jgi:hypothetical protein
LYLKISRHHLEIWWSQIEFTGNALAEPVNGYLRPLNWQLMPWNYLMFPCTENETNTWYTFHIQPESIKWIFKYAATSKKNVCINSVTMNLKITQFSLHTIEKWASFIVEGNFDCHWKGEGWIGSVNLALQQATYEPL